MQAEHPDFEQPEFDPTKDPAFQQQLAEQAEAGIAFARCARDAGFAWVADPDEASGGAVELPSDLAEGAPMIAACPEEAAAGLAWMTDGELDFDWWAVLEEVAGPASGGGFSVQVERDGD